MIPSINRREFIALLGSAAAWPLAARAQQGDRVRRIGVLAPGVESGNRNVPAFIQALGDLGWTDGRNVRMDLRWGASDINRIRALAQELVGLKPDAILTNGTPATAALQRETIPIVFSCSRPRYRHWRWAPHRPARLRFRSWTAADPRTILPGPGWREPPIHPGNNG
jgi:hypothetical protein